MNFDLLSRRKDDAELLLFYATMNRVIGLSFGAIIVISQHGINNAHDHVVLPSSRISSSLSHGRNYRGLDFLRPIYVRLVVWGAYCAEK